MASAVFFLVVGLFVMQLGVINQQTQRSANPGGRPGVPRKGLPAGALPTQSALARYWSERTSAAGWTVESYSWLDQHIAAHA